jgi:HAMP domain-containing protein
MDFGPFFVLAVVAIALAGWLLNNLIRARHGYSISDDWGRNIDKVDVAANRRIELLSGENEKLTGQVSRLEERISVLERIVTDRSYQLDHEIEKLRRPAN